MWLTMFKEHIPQLMKTNKRKVRLFHYWIIILALSKNLQYMPSEVRLLKYERSFFFQKRGHCRHQIRTVIIHSLLHTYSWRKLSSLRIPLSWRMAYLRHYNLFDCHFRVVPWQKFFYFICIVPFLLSLEEWRQCEPLFMNAKFLYMYLFDSYLYFVKIIAYQLWNSMFSFIVFI